MGAGLGTSISFAQSAGQQVAMDITRGLDARRFAIPCQEVQNGKSTPESELSGDALRQTTVIYLSTIKISIQNEKVNYHVRPTLGRGFNESTK
ncbi:conjugative transposon protein TraM [Bacteroides thetaiotaomicron]|nr:conjugative transposon protein TraM [Bacteroides thetaiotaomicron]